MIELSDAAKYYLACKLEGKLFVMPTIMTLEDKLFIIAGYFTCLNGVVYELHNEAVTPQPDESLASLSADCIEVGVYEQGKSYPVLQTPYIPAEQFMAMFEARS